MIYYHELQNIDGGDAGKAEPDDDARKTEPDDCDDDSTIVCNGCFSFYSSCGWILDRGMGNQSLVRQVVIRSFNSYRGK